MIKKLIMVVLVVSGLMSSVVRAQSTPVAFAGLAFSGDAKTLEQRFPFSVRYERGLKKSGTLAYKLIRAEINRFPSANLDLSAHTIEELKGRDQAIAVALLINSETVSTESFGSLRKLLVHIRGQAMFFDFKTMTMIRSYPLSFAVIDVFDHKPSDAEIMQRVKQAYEGIDDKDGIFTRFAQVLSTASIPNQVPRFVQVKSATVSPEVMEMLPDFLTSTPVVAETWVADMLSESLSTRMGIPIVPYSKGYAVGNVLSMRVSDGEVFNLKLPSPDYEIYVELARLRKIKYEEVPAGMSYIYGAYAKVKILEPMTNSIYMDSNFKNGEVKVVPVTQSYVDDFPAFNDAVLGLFNKLGIAIKGEDKEWVKDAASSSQINNQIIKTREVLNKCK